MANWILITMAEDLSPHRVVDFEPAILDFGTAADWSRCDRLPDPLCFFLQFNGAVSSLESAGQLIEIAFILN